MSKSISISSCDVCSFRIHPQCLCRPVCESIGDLFSLQQRSFVVDIVLPVAGLVISPYLHNAVQAQFLAPSLTVQIELLRRDKMDANRRRDTEVYVGRHESSGVVIKVEHVDLIGVLVCGEKSIACRIEYEVPRGLSLCR